MGNANNNFIININSNGDDLPFYNINKLENYIGKFSNQNKIYNESILKDIFSIKNKEINSRLIKFNNFLNEQYNLKNGDKNESNEEKINSLKIKTIESIKKFVSSENNSIDNINEYIIFYNIDFLLKNYIFKYFKTKELELEVKNKNSKPINEVFNIEKFEYIIPKGSENDNFKINAKEKEIILKIKLFLKKKNISEQIRIFLNFSGDKPNLSNQKTEFIPRDISNSYKENNIYLNTKYQLNENIFNDYIKTNKIADPNLVFFDLSVNNNFNNYLEINFQKQKKNELVNENYRLKELNIIDIIDKLLPPRPVYYDKLISLVDSFPSDEKKKLIKLFPENMSFVVDNLIKNYIDIEGNKFHIINKKIAKDQSGNIIYNVKESKQNKDKDIIFEISLNLTLLDYNKKNNFINRQKLFCKKGQDRQELINAFNKSDLSNNDFFKFILKNTIKNKSGGSKSLKLNFKSINKFKNKYKNKKSLRKKKIFKNLIKNLNKKSKKKKFLNKNLNNHLNKNLNKKSKKIILNKNLNKKSKKNLRKVAF